MESDNTYSGARRASENAKRELFLKRLAAILPESKPRELVAMLELGLRTSFRVNTLRAPKPEDVVQELQSLGLSFTHYGWMPGAFCLESEEQRARLVSSAAVAEGRVFVQNPSSYLPVLALDARPGERVLDVCSSPGGKAALIAALTDNRAELWLNDKLPARVAKLRSVVELLGVRPARILQIAAEHLGKAPELVGMQFDKILLDAQCSGEGMIDLREHSPFQFWSMQRVQKYSYLQQRMLVAAFKLLKPGGTMVYSTCTFSPEENEKPVSFLLMKFADASVEPLNLPIPATIARPGKTEWNGERLAPQLSAAARIKPDGCFEGFFVCKITKRG